VGVRTLAKLLKALNSEQDPRQIALAFCFALVAGLTPLWSLHNLLVVLLVLVLRVNLSAFILGLGFFTGVAYAVDPLSHGLGLAVLTAPALAGLWTALYNTTVFRLGAFNNSITMGSLLLSLSLFVPLYILGTQLIVRYRESVLAWVQRTRLMQVLKGSRFYQIYTQVTGWTS
jgi:uncharacterized protein (TIGR03546 family)